MAWSISEGRVDQKQIINFVWPKKIEKNYENSEKCFPSKLIMVLMWLQLSVSTTNRPLINQKFEEKTCGQGPSLVAVFDDDTQLQELSNKIQVS